ncbi:MAG: tetratricopeptide repeat protein [Spirochaetes bacterium]|nr:tetratricopeptide repeat protein [Spirochaetota bacterium]
MKRIVWCLAIVLFTFVLAAGFCETVVLYKSGDSMVDVDGNGAWRKLKDGMILTDDSIVKTGADGELELEIDEERISIGRDTQTSIISIKKKLGERKKLSWLSNLSPVVKNLIGARSKHTETALMGVRGAASEEEGIDWMGELDEGDPAMQFENGKALYKEGEYGRAINVFKSLLESECPAGSSQEVSFYLGSSMFHTMQYEESISYLKDCMRQKEAYYYEVALLHSSFARYFIQDYEGAIQGFDSYVREFGTGTFAPYALLMLGKSYKVLGWRDEAKRYFDRIRSSYQDTDVYNDAVSEMKEL